MNGKTRVRFAPSPTGWLHIGGARTALFNWLFARHTGGVFILRIEDTDAARNTPEAREVIFSGLQWLGLDWDEGPELSGGQRGDRGPYFQSQRSDIYARYLERLLSEKKAYEDKGAIRFRMPKNKGNIHDSICGEVRYDRTNEPDLVIRRSDGSPVFHLVNVVDDLEMGVTHVIRGEDHLSNTHKHLALFEAFGVQPPAYAHIPLILNPGGSKMSKRDEGASLAEYQAGGWLPEALVNYLCLLGWNPKDNREAMPLTEIIQQFDLPQINRSNARFDKEKLLWMNGEYMRSLSKERFVEFSRPFLESAGLIEPGSDPVYLASVLDLLQERARVPSELIERARYFFTEDYPISDDAKQKHLNNAEYFKNLEKLLDAFEKLDAFGAEAIEAAIKSLAKENGLKPAVFIHPCRAAVSGQTGGPSLYHMLEVLGQDRVIERFRRALGKSRLNAVKKGR